MYDSVDDFYNNSDDEIRDAGLELNSVGNGVFYYGGVHNKIDILVKCGMSSIDDVTYLPFTTINDLLQSDYIQIYFNDECVLWNGH